MTQNETETVDEVQFDKAGKTVTAYVEGATVKIDWGEQGGYVESVAFGEVYVGGLEYNGEPLDAFTVDDETADDIHSLIGQSQKNSTEQELQELLDENQEAVKKAKETGEPQKIKTVGTYNADTKDTDKFGAEAGRVTVYRVVTPEGEIATKEVPSY